MTLFFAFALLIVAAAVVLLFAMVGELTARLPRLSVGYRDPFVRPLDEARVGARPSRWPHELAGLAEAQEPVCLVVLSTACATCEDVGRQLSERLDDGDLSDTAVAISCGDRGSGSAFVHRYRLERLPAYVDEGGTWLVDAFGVRTSPTGLMLRRGVLDSAYVFGDIASLQATIIKSQKEVAVI